ncbi:MAG: GTPase HflX [Acidimicrobiia bacterium]
MTQRHEARGRRRLTATETDFGVVRQRALLVGTDAHDPLDVAEASLEELALLVDTAGADPVHAELQRRKTLDPATYIGAGKVAELQDLVVVDDIDVVVFDDELSPAQQRNLEGIFSCDVVDRTALILDIFAQHAKTQEGMVQVELAQLRYRMPRLRGRGKTLSQQAGGIGTRGPGETQLETDRRRLQRRMSKLEHDLEGLARVRATQRKARQRAAVPVIALVGYTNAGKSTLLNRLTHAEVLVEDRLFATLDPTTRRLTLPGGETVVCTDTVGFVRKLPHQLVEAFRSTLEEVTNADLLLHVVDASSDHAERQIDAVRTVLHEIGASEIPECIVGNKIDLADPDTLARFRIDEPSAVLVSGRTGEGFPELMTRLVQRLHGLSPVVELEVPYARADVLAALHRDGDVLAETHGDGGTRVRARIPAARLGRFEAFLVSPPA